MKNKTYLWTVEKYFHAVEKENSKNTPLHTCATKEEAIDVMEKAIAEYASQFNNPVIDRTISHDVLVYESETTGYPYMEFNYYKTLLLDEYE